MPLPNIDQLLDIGVALSKEKDVDKLLETIIDAAMNITDCDGGTLYILKDDALHFKIMITRSLGLRRGVDGEAIDLPPVPLYGQNVSGYAALKKAPINITDVYENEDYSFAGSKKYDAMTGYKTTSMLTVPMEDDHSDVIGVLQLINAQDADGGVIPFAAEYEHVVFSLASQAAICLTNRNYADEVTELLNSFVRVMSTAIDARSPYNANHSRNMARYAERFLEWLNEHDGSGWDEARTRQLLMSAWLHDVGKLVVPLEVMDKESRLGPKINAVLDRFKLFGLQNEIDYLKNSISKAGYELRAGEISKAGELVAAANTAGALTEGQLSELRALGEKSMNGPDGETPCLTEDELTCLMVRFGTLTNEERGVMENHVLMTRRMLSEMNFPKRFQDVPDWASAHHEFLNGKGYPDKLAEDAIPLEVRILTILDIYDALTARDRPYKPGMPAEKAFSILESMAGEGKLDTGLLRLFKESEAWKQ